MVYGYIRVKRGTIWEKSFIAETPRHLFDEGLGDLLVGEADGGTSFAPFGNSPGLGLHPEYSIRAAGPCAGCRDGACTVCEMIRTKSTPSASPDLAKLLFDFDLGCLSSWRYCSDPAEMMPSAWRLYVQEKGALEKETAQESSRNWKECHINLELAGRDHRFVLLTEVVSIKTSLDSGYTRYAVALRGVKSLKNGAQVSSLLLTQPFVGWSDTALPGGTHMSDLKPGSGIILLFDREGDATDAFSLGSDPCSCVPDTGQNRAAIERGIARDGMSDED